MVKIDIPAFKKIEIKHLVLDYNGTLAIDGKLIKESKPLLDKLSNQIKIHVLTADTFKSSKDELSEIDCNLIILESDSQDTQKNNYIKKLGKNNTIAIGNGLNDALMLKTAIIGIVLIQKEGTSVKALKKANIVCNSIVDALELLTNPLRMVASLRR